MKDYAEFGFEPVEPEATARPQLARASMPAGPPPEAAPQPYSEFGFEPMDQSGVPGRLESFGRGVAQGLTLGFSDEIVGGVESLFTDKTYQRARDESRAANKTAEAAHGGYYLGGEITGGLAGGVAAVATLPASAPTLGTAVAGGAGYGAVSGLGSSEADLTTLKGENYLEAANDMAGGALVGGAAGALGHGIVKGAGALIKRLRPASSAIEKLAPDIDKAAMAEGQALVQDTGVPLNAAQITKSPALLAMQERLKDLPGGAALLEKQRLGQIEQLHQGLQDTLKSNITGPDAVKRVAAGYKALEKATNSQIANLAKRDFGLVDQLAGNKKFIPLDETLATIRSLRDSMRSAVQTSENRAALAQLSRLEKQLLGPAAKPSGLLNQFGQPIAPTAAAAQPLTTAGRLQNALSGWGYASRSSDTVFKDVGRSESRRIAKAVFGALHRDLDNAAAQAGKLGKVGQALSAARDNYAKMMAARSTMRDELLDSAVKAMSKNHPETFTTKLLSKGAVSDQMIARTMGTVHAMDAEAAQAFRAAGMTKLLDSAAPKASSRLSQVGAKIHPSKLVDLDQKAGSRIAALFTGDPAGLAAYRKLVEVAKRMTLLGEKAPERAWAGLVERMPFWKSTAAGAAAGASIAGPVGGVAGAAGAGVLARKLAEVGERMTAKRLAWILTDKDAMQLLQRALNPKMGTTATQATQAATALLYRLNSQEAQ